MNPHETLARRRKAAALARAIAESLSGQPLPAELPEPVWTLAAKAAGVPLPSDETKLQVMALLSAWERVRLARLARESVLVRVGRGSALTQAVEALPNLDRAIWSLVETALNGKEPSK